MLIFGLSVPGSGCGVMTTHVPHLGHVTHEHTMRWAIMEIIWAARYAFAVCERACSSETDGQEELRCVFST